MNKRQGKHQTIDNVRKLIFSSETSLIGRRFKITLLCVLSTIVQLTTISTTRRATVRARAAGAVASKYQ